MKNIKKVFLLLAVAMVIIPITNTFAAPLQGYKQVANVGGCNSNTDDGVKVCKTISESNIENYFDITLSVETTSKIEEITKAQDLAVVLVMDISNTMNNKFGNNSQGGTRLDAAKNSAKNFINKFYNYSNNVDAVRKIGLVTFNRDSYDIFGGLKDVTGKNKVENAEDLTGEIDGIIAPGVSGEIQENRDKRWTNMEAGLKRAYDLLLEPNVVNVKNKYVIFLTDGLPTTYIQTDYTGYTPRLSTQSSLIAYGNGNFYNFQSKVAIGTGNAAGPNYSEYGARKAEIQALNMKNKNIKIYSIGVDITSQHTLFHLLYEGYANTVDTDTEDKNYNYTESATYKKARYYTVLPGVNKRSNTATTDKIVKGLYNNTSYYKTWLSEYIGSDSFGTTVANRKYYFDSDNTAALEAAYNQIFEHITEMSIQEVNASWVAEDPMNTSSQPKYIQFIGLYDDNNELKNVLNINNNNESDTARYNTEKDTISWDLKNSQSRIVNKTENGKKVTYYVYELKYRIRLENELNNFNINTNYKTNGTTSLSYVVMETVEGVNVRSDLKTINFKIPEINGYLGTLTFSKVSSYNNTLLSGVKFKLTHATDCPCKNEKKHMVDNYSMEQTSNNGIVTFSNIPSGHIYKLQEINNYALHESNTITYNVQVSYGNVITNINNNTIVNKHISKDITIEKLVQGIETNKEFNFELTATYNGTPLVGKYNIIKNNITNQIEFINGKITFNLKNNEKIILKDLPISTSYNIKELDTEGFVVKYQVNDGEYKVYNENNLENINLDDNNKILFINASGYELPETGSSSSLILIIIGYLLLIGPIIYIGYDIYKRKSKLTF